MGKFFFVDHVWDIWAVSGHKEVDVGVGYDMFRTDVAYGQPYNSEMPQIDYASLQKEWNAMNSNEQTEAYSVYHDFVGKYYSTICGHWVAKDRKSLDQLVEAFKESYDNKPDEEEKA